MTTTTETNDIEALLTVITKEDLEGTLAQLRAAINVFAKNPKPAIAENAKGLIESAFTKAKNITAHALAAHKTLDQFEKQAEAKALASNAERERQWDAYSTHLKEQLDTCNRELAAAQGGRARPSSQASHAETQTPIRKSKFDFTPSQKIAVRETIRKSGMHLQKPISYLLRVDQPITIEIIKQVMPLDRLGLHYSVHDVIYYATYKSLLDEREKLRARMPYEKLSNCISNVFHAMMNAVGY